MAIRILLIEDNPDHVQITKRVLERAEDNYHLDSVSDSQGGLRRIFEQDYDLILCDYRMPGLNALEILRELKRKGKELPFIVVTASGNERAAVALMKEGAYDYILKDLSYENTLPMVIKRSIERYNVKKEKERAEEELKDAYQKLKTTQEQLIQSSKMAAMGQLAAGVSHELNQPLTGIKGFAQAALMDLEENNPIREDLNKIIEQADRMDNVIKNIRFFARKSEFKMEQIDVNRPVEDSLMLLSQQLKIHNIRLNTSLDKNLPKIQGDHNQLQQAFLNLISNARDAIDSLKSSEGGELFIKTILSRNKKNIEVTFKDTGCGIPKENLDNIFNPFFTTKSLEGGIGLGLSILYRIIEDHKGRIKVKSEEGKGATLRIILPISE